jgi:DNA-binding MarR family transcriptional regulator
MPRTGITAPADLPDLECACASIRRAARLVTLLYGDELGRNIEPSQFALLTVLQRFPGRGQMSLGRVLGLDKTTLSRNLRLMKANGWIEPALTDDDLRERGYRLTAAGEKLLAAKKPGWKRAQDKLRASLSAGEWEIAMKVFGRVAAAALEATKCSVR